MFCTGWRNNPECLTTFQENVLIGAMPCVIRAQTKSMPAVKNYFLLLAELLILPLPINCGYTDPVNMSCEK